MIELDDDETLNVQINLGVIGKKYFNCSELFEFYCKLIHSRIYKEYLSCNYCKYFIIMSDYCMVQLKLKFF